MNAGYSITNVAVSEKRSFIELKLLSKMDPIARIGAEILFLAFRQKKIVADSRK